MSLNKLALYVFWCSNASTVDQPIAVLNKHPVILHHCLLAWKSTLAAKLSNYATECLSCKSSLISCFICLQSNNSLRV